MSATMETLPPQPMSGYQYPPPPQSTGVPQGYGPGPVGPGPAPSTFAPPPSTYAPAPPLMADTSLDHGQVRSVRATKSTAEFALREYMTLQGRRYRGEIGIEDQLRQQAGVVVRDLRLVRAHVADMVHAAEGHRWRRWLVGGVLGTFVPLVRRLFRRPEKNDGGHADSHSQVAANDTEYAFGKSKNMIARILDSTKGKGGLVSVAFFVFAVLYVFQNEVSLRVAKTVAKRLKRLSTKVERGEEDVDEKDMELLQGWRWRVLLWSE